MGGPLLFDKQKGQIFIEFLISFLIILFLFGFIISCFNYDKIDSKIKLINEKVKTKYCQLENSLKYNYFEISSDCGLFLKEDVYAEKKYG